MIIDLSSLSSSQTYHLMTQTIIPRPIAWVVSQHANGNTNLAPFSYFNAVCSDPPLMILSIGSKDEETLKDTRRNILERHEFVVHIPSADQIDAVNASAASMAEGVSEIETLQLPTTAWEQDNATVSMSLPRLSDCPIAFACRHHQDLTLGPKRQGLILGEITAIYLKDSVISGERGGIPTVDAGKVNPLMRLGANQYADLGSLLTASRPK